VYATFQKQAAGVAAFLDANGVSAAAYHAGKAPKACSPSCRAPRAHLGTRVKISDMCSGRIPTNSTFGTSFNSLALTPSMEGMMSELDAWLH